MNKIILMLFMAVAVIGIYSSCKKDNAHDGGEPRITHVRITAPEASDSLLIGATQGRLIAIMGENLQNAVQVWFNDQRAVLTPTYITSNSIIVRIPNQIPLNITNKIKIIFSNGKELLYDFEVQISRPALNSMLSEYVKEGDTAVIMGDYFYAPIVVTFNGGATAEILSVKDQEIKVRVPAGALKGPITVKSNFGETKSNFWFRDDRNLLLHFDPWEGWWGQAYVKPASDPLAISGNFIRMTKSIGEWAWEEWMGGPETALSTKNALPDDAVLNPSKYNLKFEINTLRPFNNGRIKIQIGQIFNPQPDPNTEPYFFNPPFDTKGRWNTVTISFDEVVKNYKVNWGVRPQGYGARVWFHGPGALNADIAFDNLRVVPKVSQ